MITNNKPQIRKPTFFQKVANYASEDVKFPLPLVILFETISHFHVMSIVVKAAYSSVSNSSTLVSFMKYVILGSGIFSLWDVLTSDSISMTLWVVFALFLILYILLLIAVVIMTYYHAKHQLVFQILSGVALVHSRILFYPFHYLFLSIINVVFVNKNTVASNLIGGKSIGGATIILAIINVMIGALKEMVFYRINKSKNAYTAKNNTFFRLNLLQKFVCPIILIFGGNEPHQAIKIMVAAITILYCCLSFYTLYTKLSFYNITMLKYTIALLGMTLTISVIGIYTVMDKGTKISDTLLVLCVLLVMKIALIKLNERFEKILCGYIPTAEYAIHLPILLKQYTKRYTGLILSREVFPEGSLYFYNSFDPNLDEDMGIKDPILRSKAKHDFFAKIIEHFLNTRINYFKSQAFLLYLARIYMKKLTNASKALSLIEKAKSKNHSIPIRNSIHNLQLGLQESFFKRLDYKHEELELANYFIFREDFNNLKDNMQEEIRCHLDFWQEISQDNVAVQKVVELSNKIDMIYSKIRSRWRRKSKRFSEVYPSSLLMYGLYIDSIRGLPQESMPIIQRFYNFNKNNGYKSKMGTLNDQTAIILASMEKDKMGMVIDASNTVESLFMIPKDNLVGDKINVLMPSFLTKHHDIILERYSRETGSQKLEKKIHSYGKTIDNFIIELDIDLKLYPFLDKGVNIMAYMKQKNPEEKLFILSPEGTVAGCSNKLQELGTPFKLNFKTAKTLQNFDELEKVNHAFNMIYGVNDTRTQIPLESDVDFMTKEKLNTDDFNFQTRENQFTENYTQLDTKLDTNADMLVRNLRTKVEDVSPIHFTTEGDAKESAKGSAKFQSPQTRTIKKNATSDSNKFSAGKTKIQLSEDEAKAICTRYEGGFTLKHINNNITLEGKKTDLVMELKIQPYVLNGEVYKVCRVYDLHQQDQKQKGQTKTLTTNPFQTLQLTQTQDFKGNQLTALQTNLNSMNSSFASRGSEISDESDIPEERSEIMEKEVAKKKADNQLFEKQTFDEMGDDSDNLKSLEKKIDSFLIETRKDEAKEMMEMGVVRSLKGASSTKSHSRMDLKLIKTLNDFFGEQKIRLVTRISVYGVYLIMVGVLVLAFVNYLFNTQALNEISNGVLIVGTASKRLTAALRAWQWVLVIYSRIVGLRGSTFIRSLLTESCYEESQNMQRLNNELKTNLNEFGSTEIVDIIFGTEIRFWDPITSQLVTSRPLDSFTANNILAINNIVIATWNRTDAELLARTEPLITTNNTSNDFLISSENQITDILVGLDNIVTKNENSLLLILIAENLSLVVLVVSLLLVARVVLNTYSRTFQALVRLTPKSIDDRVYRIKKFQASLNDNIEAKSFVKNLNLYFSFFEENAERKLNKLKEKDKKNRIFSRNYTNRGLVMYMAKYLGISFLFVGIISGLFVILYVESIDSFNKLNNISTQLSITNKLSYQSCLVLASFYFQVIFADNPRYMIREEAPALQVDKNLATFGNVNQELLNTLFNTDRAYDTTLQNFLQKDICTYIEDTNKTTCLSSTQGGTLGLLGLNLKYYTISNSYISMYKDDNSLDNAKLILTSYFADVTLDVTILDQAYTFLTDYITSNFKYEVSNLENVNLVLSLGAMIFILIATFMIQRITIKTLVDLDNGQKKLFRVLTYNVFSQNKSVAYILKREFGDEVEGLNRLLNA